MRQSGGPFRRAWTGFCAFGSADLSKIKKGDILVANMTRQDFVPYLRRCAAVVTAEGGLTCHAAIICRELAKPCVVGAAGVLSAFKDGDRVFVDAVQGTIQKRRLGNVRPTL